MHTTRINDAVAPLATRSFSTCTMVPPVAIMGSLTSTRSSGPMDLGSLFRYSVGCRWAVWKSDSLPQLVGIHFDPTL